MTRYDAATGDDTFVAGDGHGIASQMTVAPRPSRRQRRATSSATGLMASAYYYRTTWTETGTDDAGTDTTRTHLDGDLPGRRLREGRGRRSRRGVPPGDELVLRTAVGRRTLEEQRGDAVRIGNLGRPRLEAKVSRTGNGWQGETTVGCPRY